MSQFFNTIYQFCYDFQTVGYIAIIVVGILLVAVPLIVGSEESREKAKRSLPWKLLGIALLMGVFTLASDLGARLSF